MIAAAGAIIAWLGSALLVLIENRVGSALGVALAGGGLAIDVGFSSGGLAGALLLLASAAVCAALSYRAGYRPFMSGPTTPRTIFVLLGGVFSFWLALFVIDVPGGRALRSAIAAVVCLLGGSFLGTTRRANSASLASVLALGLGASALQTPSARYTSIAAATAAVLTLALANIRHPAAESADS